jgi:hypothetical protein
MTRFQAATRDGCQLLAMQCRETFQQAILKRKSLVEKWVTSNMSDAYRDAHMPGSLSLSDLHAGEVLCTVKLKMIKVCFLINNSI